MTGVYPQLPVFLLIDPHTTYAFLPPQVTGVDESMYDDAFTIQHVSEELSDYYRFVAGMVPGVQNMALSVSAR